MDVVGMLILYSPVILFGLLFLWSYHREPRQFRNAIWLLLFMLCLSMTLLLQFGRGWMVLPIVILMLGTMVISVVFLLVNTVIVIRHEGICLVTLLPLLLAVAFLIWLLYFPSLLVLGAPGWLMVVFSLISLEGLWFFFTFAALLLYSTLYRLLPRRRMYDYILIHGAGLQGDKPTPLLCGRIDKAVRLWRRQNMQGKFIASGGQGGDEGISEAEAIRDYLVDQCQVPAEAVLLEDKSTTTLENISFSKVIMDDLGATMPHKTTKWLNPAGYRCALVTSDYHVFRASEYAHNIKLKADGIGSHTRSYYWPAAFIREFIAITRRHMWPYYVIAGAWLFMLGTYFHIFG